MLEIEERMNELRNEEYNLINEQRRLDKARDVIKEKIIGTSGVHIFKENLKRQKVEQKKEEKQVPSHFPFIILISNRKISIIVLSKFLPPRSLIIDPYL